MAALKDFDLEHWWKLAAAAGALIAIASAPTQFRPGMIIGIGILLFGIGEWINHPVRTGLGYGGVLTGYPRSNKPLGLLIAALGIGLFAFGLYRLVAFAP